MSVRKCIQSSLVNADSVENYTPRDLGVIAKLAWPRAGTEG